MRNSGAQAVVEGIGDHGCEYMTGGRVVILGSTGRNFAAGMSGGIAYVYDPEGVFPGRCNMGMVALETVDLESERAELHAHIQKHVDLTGSQRGQDLLASWPSSASDFVKVMPHEYKRVLMEEADAEELAA